MLLRSLKVGNLTLKNNIFLAPLAGYTSLPTRRLLRKDGVGIAYSEMVSADGLHYNYTKSAALLRSEDGDTPLGIQIFGSTPEMIYSAYKSLNNIDFDLIDINCGCSVKKVINNRCGAYLLRDPKLIHNIIKTIKDNTDKPVTLKIRSGWDINSMNYLEIYDAAYSAGAALITLHPRTRSELFEGRARWNHIRELKSISKIPVIGNGDIFSGDDAVRMFRETGCDGIMLARGVIQNPFLVEEVVAALQGIEYKPPLFTDRLFRLKEHIKGYVECFGETKGIKEFRKFIPGYIKGIKNGSKFRTQLNTIDNPDQFLRIIDVIIDAT